MTVADWVTLVGICFLGACSPGPSLAIVLKHSLTGGRLQGSVVAMAHAFGVGLYALLSISGLALVIVTSERLFALLQWVGALYLIWLGLKGLRSKAADPAEPVLTEAALGAAARDGFMIVFLNPKIALFFIALFAQLVGVDNNSLDKLICAFTAMIVDGLWYLLMAWLMSQPRWHSRLQRNAHWLQRLFGVILIGLAAKLVVSLLQ